LYLIPTVLAAETAPAVLPPQIKEVIRKTEHFFAENLRTARRFISELQLGRPIQDLYFYLLDKDTPKEEMRAHLQIVLSGHDAGVLSEAGCPGVADPGAVAVSLAHQLGIQVVPLVGPSSILLALMASGFSGHPSFFTVTCPSTRQKGPKRSGTWNGKPVANGKRRFLWKHPSGTTSCCRIFYRMPSLIRSCALPPT
jgi:16S rRNA (cytidine1402-2'-O)-methyltransferase